jgi:hypothetical protein
MYESYQRSSLDIPRLDLPGEQNRAKRAGLYAIARRLGSVAEKMLVEALTLYPEFNDEESRIYTFNAVRVGIKKLADFDCANTKLDTQVYLTIEYAKSRGLFKEIYIVEYRRSGRASSEYMALGTILGYWGDPHVFRIVRFGDSALPTWYELRSAYYASRKTPALNWSTSRTSYQRSSV